MDTSPALEDALALGAQVRRVVGDSTYGTKENIAAVEKASMGRLSTTDFEKKSPYYGSSRFVYEPERDLYRCPQGEPLRLYTLLHRKGHQVPGAVPGLQCLPLEARMHAGK